MRVTSHVYLFDVWTVWETPLQTVLKRVVLIQSTWRAMLVRRNLESEFTCPKLGFSLLPHMSGTKSFADHQFARANVLSNRLQKILAKTATLSLNTPPQSFSASSLAIAIEADLRTQLLEVHNILHPPLPKSDKKLNSKTSSLPSQTPSVASPPSDPPAIVQPATEEALPATANYDKGISSSPKARTFKLSVKQSSVKPVIPLQNYSLSISDTDGIKESNVESDKIKGIMSNETYNTNAQSYSVHEEDDDKYSDEETFSIRLLSTPPQESYKQRPSYRTNSDVLNSPVSKRRISFSATRKIRSILPLTGNNNEGENQMENESESEFSFQGSTFDDLSRRESALTPGQLDFEEEDAILKDFLMNTSTMKERRGSASMLLNESDTDHELLDEDLLADDLYNEALSKADWEEKWAQFNLTLLKDDTGTFTPSAVLRRRRRELMEKSMNAPPSSVSIGRLAEREKRRARKMLKYTVNEKSNEDNT